MEQYVVEYIVKGVETVAIGGLFMLGMKEFFRYLDGRSARSDEREKEHQAIQRELQKVVSNHMNHNTDAFNKLSHSVDNSAEASMAVVEVIDNCQMVQDARKNAKKV